MNFRGADGTILEESEPTVKRRVIREETSATMCRLMEGVVTEGAGKHAAVNGYYVEESAVPARNWTAITRAPGS